MWKRLIGLVVVAIVVGLGGCRNIPETQTREKKHANGQLKSREEFIVKNDKEVLSGKAVYWYPSGKLMAEGVFGGGRYHGEWTYYYESGKVKSQGTYAFGQKDGEWKDYEEDTGKLTTSRYKDGKLTD